jgi:hypothetical protein
MAEYARESRTFEELPFDFYRALLPLIEGKTAEEKDEVINAALADWDGSNHANFKQHLAEISQEAAEERLIQFTRAWVLVKMGANVDGESQHG